MIHVVAIITTIPGKRSDVLAEFDRVIPAVLGEQGCIEYQPVLDASEAGPMQSALGEDTYIVIEKWASMSDLHAHASADHMKAYAQKVGAMISDRQIHVLSNA